MILKYIFLPGVLFCCAVAIPVIADETTGDVPANSEKKFYKSTGPDGEIIYTDKPVKGGEEIKVPKGSSYEPAAIPRFEASTPTPKREPFAYESLVIAKPAHKETIWSNEGKLGVSVNLQPSLRITHTIAISVDGNRLKSGKAQSYTLSSIDPGEHELKVEVVDQSGKVIKTQAATFYMKRHIIKR